MTTQSTTQPTTQPTTTLDTTEASETLDTTETSDTSETSDFVYRVSINEGNHWNVKAFVLDKDEADAIAATIPDNRGSVIPVALTTLAQWGADHPTTK